MDLKRDLIVTLACDQEDTTYVMCSDSMKLLKNKITGKHCMQIAFPDTENIADVMNDYEIVQDINY